MSTRLYFTVSGSTTAVSPAVSLAWANTSGVTRHVMNDVKGSSPTGYSPNFIVNPGIRSSSLERQYISRPLNGAQTINGTISGQLVVKESAINDNLDQIVAVLKVVNNAGTLTSGMLLSLGAYNPIGEFSAVIGGRNKKIFSGQSVTSVNAGAGDRIILELGYWSTPGGTSILAQSVYGETPPAGDLPGNEIGAAGVPWIEFSSNLSFSAEQVAVTSTTIPNSLMLMGYGV